MKQEPGSNDALYRRAVALMPWGTQTNAKRLDPALADVMPAFIERAEGCRMQSADGRWFIDYRAALGPILLGYRHSAVDAAVRAQLEKGVLFSMASPLEVALAEALTACLPGVDQVRFMKTGNAANLCAVRLARAYTGRDHLVTCGYHGHGDWFACGTGAPGWWTGGTTGVPKALDALVTRIPYGDVAAAEQVFATHGAQIAALLMVPYDWGPQADEPFVRRMRELATAHGTVLIFDQVLTGFRLALGGAQEYFGVVPDLTTYAKALANGYPLAAYGGQRAVMQMLDQVTLTTTYAGETLSLAAALATLKVLQTEPVLDHIWQMGRRLMDGFDALAQRLNHPARAYGLPPAPGLRFDPDAAQDQALRTAFYRALLEQGIFPNTPWLITYAHQPADIDETLAAMEKALNALPA